MPIGINGSGTITGISAGGLPDATITQAELASGVAGTGPAFRAYATGATSVSNNVITKVLFAAEDFDTNNCYNTSTSVFTPNVAGVYVLSTAVSCLAAASGGYLSAYIRKNGSVIAESTLSTGTGIYVNTSNTIAYANGTTDYFDACIFQSTGTTQTTTVQPYYYFAGCMVRSA